MNQTGKYRSNIYYITMEEIQRRENRLRELRKEYKNAGPGKRKFLEKGANLFYKNIQTDENKPKDE